MGKLEGEIWEERSFITTKPREGNPADGVEPELAMPPPTKSPTSVPPWREGVGRAEQQLEARLGVREAMVVA